MSSPYESAGAGGGTASIVYSDTVSGWHVLKVEGYSKFKGIGVGQRVQSHYFTVGGHDWHITFFPNGCSHDTADWICVDLYLSYVHRDVKVRFTLSLLDRAREPADSYSRSAEVTFSDSPRKRSYGFRQFITKEALESSFLKDDSFEIRCDLTIADAILTRVIPMESTSVTPPMTDLQRHFADLLDSKVGGDVTFEVSGELFTAHRYVLAARSSVFMAELFGPMKENGTEHVWIQDMEARVFKIMLQFIYATTLVLAEQHACQGLKDACFEFLKRPGNLKAVMASDGFKHLKKSCTSLLQEITTRF